MLYSMLVGIYSTRLTKDEASRVPSFQKIFSKLVINELQRAPMPPPLSVSTRRAAAPHMKTHVRTACVCRAGAERIGPTLVSRGRR